MNRFRQNKRESEPNQPERPSALRGFEQSRGGAVVTARQHRIQVIIYWLLPVLVFILILLVGTYVALKFYKQDAPIADQSEQASFLASSNQIDVPELLEAHLNALGGRMAVEQIRSVRYEGRVIFEKGESDFQMLISLPDKGMLVTDPGEPTAEKFMLNGDVAWRVIEQENGARDELLLGKEATESLKWSLRVHNTLRSLALEGRVSELSAREVDSMGRPCYEISRTMPDGRKFVAIMDKETLYLLKTVETVRSGNDADEFEVVYEDHRMVSGIVEPYNTKLYRNGKLDNEVIIRSVRINPGLISSLFEVPDDLLKQRNISR